MKVTITAQDVDNSDPNAAAPRRSPAGSPEPGGGAPPEVTAAVPSHRCAAAALLAVPGKRLPPAQIRALSYLGRAENQNVFPEEVNKGRINFPKELNLGGKKHGNRKV